MASGRRHPEQESRIHQRDLTELLQQWRAGDPEVLGEIVPMLYEPLRSLAHQRLRRAPAEDSLNTTGLVHEAYLRFIHVAGVASDSREHFLALASRVMRGVLVDHARARVAEKRGGGMSVVELHEDTWIAQVDIDRVAELDEALSRLEALDERQARMVEQRYFGGLTLEEIARATDVSLATVKRDLRSARAWLAAELGSPSA
jgi:RNA polymerase sigma factor (TIGR02999 family)